MVYREVWEAVGLTDRKLAKALKVLVEDKDAKIRVQAINIVTKARVGNATSSMSTRARRSSSSAGRKKLEQGILGNSLRMSKSRSKPGNRLL